jgi:plastocyanin
MEQRRKLIDELVQTGVPVVTAAETGQERSPWLSFLFLLVPIIAVVILVAAQDELGGGASEEGGEGGGGAPAGDIVASNTAFNTDELTFSAGEEVSLEFVNEDSIAHNWALYENESDAEAQSNPIADGEEITQGSTTVDFTAPEPGDYPFQCDLHPTSMIGTAVVEEAGGGGGGGAGDEEETGG